MSLEWLQVSRFRNIDQASLALSPGFNLIVGANGSGKTSILESAHFLASARSFRSATLDPVVQRGSEDTLVLGRVRRSGRLYRLGVSRGRDGTRDIHVNDERVLKASELARLLPTLILGPDSVDLLLGPPAARRRFLNWGLFHVKHAFTEDWEKANRCLRQRNQLLRQGSYDQHDLDSWTVQLAEYTEAIHQARLAFVEAFQPVFAEAAARMAGLEEVRFDYFRGWDRQTPILDVLRQDLDSDEKRGFTQRGFHRADVRISLQGQPAVKVCSRGELKSLVWALILAQGEVVNRQLDDKALYLVDDLASELDRDHRRRVCRYLAETGAQVLLTGIEHEALKDACEGLFDPQTITGMFHVKHFQVSGGEVKEVEGQE